MRRWVLLGGVRDGSKIGAVYHHVAKGERRTACGIQLPDAFAMFWGPKHPRCASCRGELAACRYGASHQ